MICAVLPGASGDLGLYSGMPGRTGTEDTSPEVLRLQYARFRGMSPAEKLRLVSELTRSANQLAMAGLAHRHPQADRQELLLRLAVQRLGADVVAQVYGWREPPDGS